MKKFQDDEKNWFRRPVHTGPHPNPSPEGEGHAPERIISLNALIEQLNSKLLITKWYYFYKAAKS